MKELVTSIHGNGMDQRVRELALEPFMEEVLQELTEDGKVVFKIQGG